LPSKTPEEVKKYSEVFWKKWEKIEGGQKYIDRIEKGEQEIEKYRSIREAI
jgi:SWI/SNF-related matrix-associated actin-dependent regulator of chromatin subfamily A member 5